MGSFHGRARGGGQDSFAAAAPHSRTCFRMRPVRMKLVDDQQQARQGTAPALRLNGVNNGNGQANGHSNGHSNGHGNGLNGHTIIEESESDAEEVEPVSASLVLRVVSDTPSPSVSRKPSFRREGAPAFLTEEPSSGTFLQVQVQRSSSSSSLGRRSAPRSRNPSSDDWTIARQPSYSRDSSVSPSPSLYDFSEADLSKPNGVNTMDFMQRVSNQTKVIQQGIKTLRGEVDNPMHLLDVGQEAIVLSGLNKHASESLKNIKNLYDETKYLKTYLEKLEAKVHYDVSVTHKNPQSPPWYRRLLFLGGILGTGAWIWSRQDPSGFERSVEKMSQQSLIMWGSCVDFLTNKAGSNNLAVTLK